MIYFIVYVILSLAIIVPLWKLVFFTKDIIICDWCKEHITEIEPRETKETQFIDSVPPEEKINEIFNIKK